MEDVLGQGRLARLRLVVTSLTPPHDDVGQLPNQRQDARLPVHRVLPPQDDPGVLLSPRTTPAFAAHPCATPTRRRSGEVLQVGGQVADDSLEVARLGEALADVLLGAQLDGRGAAEALLPYREPEGPLERGQFSVHRGGRTPSS